MLPVKPMADRAKPPATQGVQQNFTARLQQRAARLRDDVLVLYQSLSDPAVPLHIKALVVLLLAYVASPLDLIPDFIPVLGLLDEVILLPLFVSGIRHLLAGSARQQTVTNYPPSPPRGLQLLGVLIVITAWLCLCWGIYNLWLALPD